MPRVRPYQPSLLQLLHAAMALLHAGAPGQGADPDRLTTAAADLADTRVLLGQG
ncbi:hypothetical protein KQ313_07830 [Synechococcus sp. CS-1325]|uniref:hypothetical protein n=1 Tax=Synechococcus sp. CS-1325 TaxID=2847979 RepID=UPI00223BD325|nr:hypothetical protein [Synechococcus sp. CS-1325]MCT0199584.1 hypothetical protein [Synechococcus sp. CS-1325]